MAHSTITCSNNSFTLLLDLIDALFDQLLLVTVLLIGCPILPTHASYCVEWHRKKLHPTNSWVISLKLLAKTSQIK